MAARSPEEVKRELASERERLSTAVRALRARVEAVRRKLPVIAIGAAGAGLVLRTAGKRFRRRNR